MRRSAVVALVNDLFRFLTFSQAFESGPAAFTAGTDITYTHNFGVKPKVVQLYLKCVTDEVGYVAGDELLFEHVDSNTSRGASILITTTQIIVVLATGLAVTNRTTHLSGLITVANWEIGVRAYA